MEGLFSESRKTHKKAKNKQSAATKTPAVASQIGNQGMLRMMGDTNSSDGAIKDLEQRMKAKTEAAMGNAQSADHTPAAEEADSLDPLGLGEGEDREAWLDNLPGARALYQKLEDKDSGKVEEEDNIDKLARQLRASKKGGLGSKNSDKFNAIQFSIGQVLASMEKNLTGDTEKDRGILNELVSSYGSLVDACQAYLNRRAFTADGKARQGIVAEILKQVQTDFAGIRSLSDQLENLPPDKRKGSIRQAIGVARTRTITLKQGKESDLKHVGGAISHIAVLDGNSTTDGSTGYFKEDDVYTHKGEDKAALSWQEAVDLLQKRIGIKEELYQKLRACAEWEEAIALPEYKTDRSVHDFVEECNDARGARKTLRDHITSSGLLDVNLKEGETFNVSKRNVATSRVANLLGIGDLVAQSETAELVDAEGGGRRTGNLMQKARGKEAASWIVDQMKAEVTKKTEGVDLSMLWMNKKLTGLDNRITPQFMKSLTSLQVLDNLVGQVDRHAGNYMVVEDDIGQLGRVQGIDNDFAFGNTTLLGDSYGRIGNQGRSILNRDGTLGIAHMDKALADRILQLKKSDVELMLADVLEPWAIQSFWGRVAEAQKAIQKDMEKNPGSGRFLTEDYQWNGKALQDFNDRTIDSFTTSYVSEFSFSAKNDQDIKTTGVDKRKFGQAVQGDREQRYGLPLWRRICMNSPDVAADTLRSCGVEKAIVEYLQQSKQLNGTAEVYNNKFLRNLRIALTSKAYASRGEDA